MVRFAIFISLCFLLVSQSYSYVGSKYIVKHGCLSKITKHDISSTPTRRTTRNNLILSAALSPIDNLITNEARNHQNSSVVSSTQFNQLNSSAVTFTNSVGNNKSNKQKKSILNTPRSLKNLILVSYLVVLKFLALSVSYVKENFKQAPKNKSISKKSSKKSKFPIDILKAAFRPMFLVKTLVVATILTLAQNYITYYRSLTTEVAYSKFLQIISESPQSVFSVRVTPAIIYFFVNGRRCLTRVVNVNDEVLTKLINSGVEFAALPQSTNIFSFVWSAAYLYFIWVMFSRLQGPKDENIGKSRDQMSLDSYGVLSFDDVAGQDKAKLEVKEICDMLRSPEVYTNLGARLPSGILLCGPPGTGKTLLARVTAAEAQVPFFACSATDFVEIFVGRGPARIRKLFKSASENSPCIIFIDEIDSIGRSRRLNSMNSEQENTLNQLLTCMDGLDTSNNGVVVIAATNRAELLDPALLRPGRFDRLVQCTLPDKDGRLAILKVHTRRLVIDTSVKLDVIAAMTNGLSGADLATLVNESAIRAVRRGGQSVSQQDMFDALRSFLTSRGMQLSAGPSIGDVAADLWKMIGLGGDEGSNGKPAVSGV